MDSKSTFRGCLEVHIQHKAPFWKAESSSFSISKELAPEDASISRYDRFESDHFVVRRLNIFGILWFLNNVIDFLSNFEMAITFDGDVVRRWFFNRWKAEIPSFPIY